MNYLKFWLFFVLSALCAGPVQAESFDCAAPLKGPEQDSLLSDIESQYRQMTDLQADFLQLSYFVGLDERKSSSGQVYFRKPGMMDWDYQEPEKQRFVADGTTLWYYQPELQQVTIGSFQSSFSSDLPVAFLLGVGELRQKFTLESACRAEDGIVAKLRPKKGDANLDQFYLLVDGKTHAPKGARILDVGGNETTIVFQKISLNKGMSEARFTFEIPRGVDVIDNRHQNVARQVNGRESPIRESEASESGVK